METYVFDVHFSTQFLVFFRFGEHRPRYRAILGGCITEAIYKFGFVPAVLRCALPSGYGWIAVNPEFASSINLGSAAEDHTGHVFTDGWWDIGEVLRKDDEAESVRTDVHCVLGDCFGSPHPRTVIGDTSTGYHPF